MKHWTRCQSYYVRLWTVYRNDPFCLCCVAVYVCNRSDRVNRPWLMIWTAYFANLIKRKVLSEFWRLRNSSWSLIGLNIKSDTIKIEMKNCKFNGFFPNPRYDVECGVVNLRSMYGHSHPWLCTSTVSHSFVRLVSLGHVHIGQNTETTV